MTKIDLPTILLRGIVLLPHNEIRLEFDNRISNSIIDLSENFHNNKILVVSQNNPLEEKPDNHQLPNIGVIALINNKIELPNGMTRIILKGLKRVKICDYLNLNQSNEVLESIVCDIDSPQIDNEYEKLLIEKLRKEIQIYVKNIPYVSNSVLSSIDEFDDLSVMTDTIIPFFQSTIKRLIEYLNEINPIERAKMILEDIYKEKEMFNIEKNLDLKVKKELDSSQREYLLREKMKLIKEELGDVSTKDAEIEKIKERASKINFPNHIKERLDLEIKRYENMIGTTPEIGIIRNYIDWLLDLPWDSNTIDNDDLIKARNILNNSHYGLDEVKTRIIEYLAVKQMKNSLKGPIICLVGPPGVGKTSLAISIADAINRNFVKISVGGINDESEIIGHRRTYLGASPGRIIASMKKAKSCNPVFLIDEIDKMTKNIQGDPASCLLSVLDPEQNKLFSDNYIEEEYDLSNVLFILTANYIENIPDALKDRLEIINLTGYTEYEKVDIALKYLIPKICKEHGIDSKFISFDKKTILNIIREYTKEAGVRELERQLSTIIRKVITQIVVNKIRVNNINITNDVLEKYLGKSKYQNNKIIKNDIGVVNGLAYTPFGGDTLPIEVNYYKGTGKLVLTGSLGDIMKESAAIALSYIKANYKKFNIEYEKLIKNDIHIHVPEGAIHKDGPSAGTALTLALVSIFTNKKIDSKIALTGEITLRGNILEIGGLKEKSLSALRCGIRKIFIPYDNIKDLDNIPKEVTDKIKYIPVKNFEEIMVELRK